jgi:hypothetical protein
MVRVKWEKKPRSTKRKKPKSKGKRVKLEKTHKETKTKQSSGTKRKTTSPSQLPPSRWDGGIMALVALPGDPRGFVVAESLKFDDADKATYSECWWYDVYSLETWQWKVECRDMHAAAAARNSKLRAAPKRRKTTHRESSNKQQTKACQEMEYFSPTNLQRACPSFGVSFCKCEFCEKYEASCGEVENIICHGFDLTEDLHIPEHVFAEMMGDRRVFDALRRGTQFPRQWCQQLSQRTRDLTQSEEVEAAAVLATSVASEVAELGFVRICPSRSMLGIYSCSARKLPLLS